MCSLLYVVLWYKGNAVILYNINLSPFQWWLCTGLMTNYLGLLSWWFFVREYNIWGAMAITYCLHTVIELGLNFYYFDYPGNRQILGLALLVMGSFLVLK
jgi:hypothetical protein